MVEIGSKRSIQQFLHDVPVDCNEHDMRYKVSSDSLDELGSACTFLVFNFPLVKYITLCSLVQENLCKENL